MKETIDLISAYSIRFTDIMPLVVDWMAARFQEHYRDWKDPARQDQLRVALESAFVDIVSQVGRKYGETYDYTPEHLSYIIDGWMLLFIERDLKEYKAAFYKDIYRLRSIDATPFETDEECAVRIFSKLQPELDEAISAYDNCVFQYD